MELDAAEVAHQVVADHLRRTARRAAHDLGQGLALGGIGRLVDDHAEHPVAVRHDPLGANDQGELQTVERDIALMPAIDAIDHQGGAMLMRRRRLRVGEDAGHR